MSPLENRPMRHDHPPPPQQLSYGGAVRRHPWVVAGIAILAIAVGVAWLLVRSPAYEASAEVLVSPLAAEQPAFVGIDVIHESGDATRTVQTAVALLQSPAAAAAAATALGPQWSGREVAQKVRVEPEGESSLVTVTARATTAADAVRIANAYASASLRVRDQTVGTQIRDRIADLDTRVSEATGSGRSADDLVAQRQELEAAGAGDPSLSLTQPAALPATQTGPAGWLMLGLIAIVGLAIGAVTALALEALERRRSQRDEAAGADSGAYASRLRVARSGDPAQPADPEPPARRPDVGG
jgi:uncharacterized protein involved in exopolysaccharide biosynthesis